MGLDAFVSGAAFQNGLSNALHGQQQAAFGGSGRPAGVVGGISRPSDVKLTFKEELQVETDEWLKDIK